MSIDKLPGINYAIKLAVSRGGKTQTHNIIYSTHNIPGQFALSLCRENISIKMKRRDICEYRNEGIAIWSSGHRQKIIVERLLEAQLR